MFYKSSFRIYNWTFQVCTKSKWNPEYIGKYNTQGMQVWNNEYLSFNSNAR